MEGAWLLSIDENDKRESLHVLYRSYTGNSNEVIPILLTCLAFIPTYPSLPLFPYPDSVQMLGGKLSVRGFIVHSDRALRGELVAAREDLPQNSQGLPVYLHYNPKLSHLGSEGYRLAVNSKSINIEAANNAGAFYGVQTLRQLLKPEGKGWQIPTVKITDHPRFPWRGMMLDVSRHFFPKSDIKHILDMLSRFKINTFHWHLVDDGGWRIEIKKYPLLTQRGAWRIPIDGTFPEYKGLNFPGRSLNDHLYGGFYTQGDVKEIVSYAAKRHINIVPEIEMPGHNLAATLSYPWLICSKDLKAGFQKETDFVWPNIFCAGKESTYKFVTDVLTEVMALFPSKVIHMGGDEVDKYLWSRCEDCKATMAREHLANPAELESYFVRRVEKFVNSKGRHIIGWDEILEGGLAPNAYVMSWRGEAGGIEAAKQHHNVVMTPWDQCYFDHDNTELPIEVALGYDPAPQSGGPNLAKYVMGAQASIWTETIPTLRKLEDRMFPRILGLSQSLWTTKREPAESFMNRLDGEMNELYQMAPGTHLRGPAVQKTVFEPEEYVSIHVVPIQGLTVRYTLDGTRPGPQSAVWHKPIKVTDGDRITIAYVSEKECVSELTQVVCASIQPVDITEVVPGVTYGVYEGKFSQVPDFQSRKPISTGVSPMINLVGDRKENYALDFNGFLKIDKPGIYRLSTLSDDGSVVWVNGAKVIDNDGPHGRIERSGILSLKAGYYKFEVGYYQANEGQSLDLMISGPGLPRTKVPKDMLWHNAHG